MGDLQEGFFPFERIWRLVDNRKATGAGEKGAGLQSSAPGPPAPVSQCYLTLAGSYLLETHRKRRVWGQSRGSSTHNAPQQPPHGCRARSAHAQTPCTRTSNTEEDVPWTHITQGTPGMNRNEQIPKSLLWCRKKPKNHQGQTGQPSTSHHCFAETQFHTQPPLDKHTPSLQRTKTHPTE